MVTYIIKVNIALAAFYLVYRLCFGRDTLFRARRVALWTLAATALAYPLVSIPLPYAIFPPDAAAAAAAADFSRMAATVELDPIAVTAGRSWGLSWPTLLAALYAAGVAVFFVRFATHLVSLLMLVRRSPRCECLGTQVRATQADTPPFSFFRWIFLNPGSHPESELRQILTHERTHVRECHSVDVIFFELLRVVFWFNPFTWLIKRSVHQNLEYLADKDVIRSGSDRREYQYRLLRLSYNRPANGLTNNFSKSQLKNRIVMMNKQSTPRRSAMKYAFILPVIFALSVGANSYASGNIAPPDQTGVIIVYKGRLVPVEDGKAAYELLKKAGLISEQKLEESSIAPISVTGYSPAPQQAVQKSINPDFFMIVEDMPTFNGGTLNDFRRWVMGQLKYPEEAMKKGEQGKVILTFIIEEDGTVSNIEVLSNPSQSLTDEAVRVVESSPAWEPGTQRGQSVRVKFTLPVDFTLHSATAE